MYATVFEINAFSNHTFSSKSSAYSCRRCLFYNLLQYILNASSVIHKPIIQIWHFGHEKEKTLREWLIRKKQETGMVNGARTWKHVKQL